MSHVPALQPSLFFWRGKNHSCWCGVFPPVVGQELALVPESTLWGRKGPIRDYPALFHMLLGATGRKKTSPK